MRYLTTILLVLSMFVVSPAFAEDAPTEAAIEVTPADADAPATTDKVVTADDDDSTASATAEAPTTEGAKVPETDEEAVMLVGQLLNAAENGQWTVLGGLVLLLLMWGLNRFGLAKHIGRKYVPWMTVSVGIIGAIAISLVDGGSVRDAVTLGVIEGGLAIALWELVFKQMTKSKSDGESRSTPAPLPPHPDAAA